MPSSPTHRLSRRLSRSFALASATSLALLVALTPAQASRNKQGEEPARQMRQLPAPDGAEATAAVGSTTDELRRLMQAQELTELRTTYNGKYGASILFRTETLHYYVALFQDRNFWRVIKTDSFEEAESLYGTFAQQTHELAQAHIDTIRMDAGKRFTERMVALNSQRLQALQQEVEQQRQQSMQVNAALQQARQQAVSLSSDLRATNSQLDTINERIRVLMAVQADPEIMLPRDTGRDTPGAAPQDAASAAAASADAGGATNETP